MPGDESVFDHLQHLNLKPGVRKGSALLVIVSSVFYTVHSEHYPLSIKDQLDSTLEFDWQENIFQEHEPDAAFFRTAGCAGASLIGPYFYHPERGLRQAEPGA